MDSNNTNRPSRGDLWSLGAFIMAGIAIVIGTAAISIARIIEVLGPGPTAVPVTFADFTPQLSYGTTGAGLPVAVDTGTITVTELPPALIVAAVLDPMVTTVIITIVASCLIALSISLMRGTIFSRRNTRLVATAGIVGIVGVGAKKLFEVMLANGALAWATDHAYDKFAVSFSPGPFFLAAFAIALICTVFVIGERLQRDAEGLV